MKRIAERARPDEALDEHQRFESLLIDLSACFVNAHADAVDDQILDAQRRICECLGLDSSLLWQRTNRPSARLTLTHMHRPYGGPPAPEQPEVQSVFPWSYAQALAGRGYVNSSLDDLPPEAAQDKASFERYGVKSNIGLPLTLGGSTPIGLLAFHTVREPRDWSEPLVQRLQLVAQHFANALERKRADAEARLHLRQLARLHRVATMGEFATALAHELNQPLGAILRNAEAAEIVLQHDTPDLDELRAIVADIRRDDERAGATIDRLRALLRQRSIELRTEKLPELVNDVMRFACADAAARGVRVVSEVDAELPAIRCDRVHAQQVLLNLVMNGIDAIADSAGSDRRVVIRAHATGGAEVEISVSDTGAGIAPESLSEVFEPFYTTKAKGMGMGLAISQTLAEVQCGRLWLATGRGETECGARFCFALPVAPLVEEGP